MQPRTEINDIVSAEDWVPTLVAAAGDPDVKTKLLQGYDAGGKTFKVHLDGYDQRDLLAAKGPDKRREFFYWTDDGNLAGLRFDQYNVVFMEQPAHRLEVWMQPLVPLRAPKILTCGPIPSSVPNMRQAGMTNGSLSTRSCLFPHRRSRTTSCNLPGVPTEAEARQLLGRPAYGSYDEAEEQREQRWKASDRGTHAI